MYQWDPSYTRRVSSYRVLYLKFLSSYNICIIYLHVIEACWKVTVAIFISAIPKILQMLWKIFLIPSLYILEKKFPCSQIFLVIFFEVMKSGHISPSKVCNFRNFQYDHRFLFSREMENIRAGMEVRLPKLTKFRFSG